jgi:ribosome-associated protein
MSSYRTPAGIEVPEAAVRFSFARTGGPGGQHVNTSSTKVLVRIELESCDLRPAQLEALTRRFGAELRVSASESRSQWRNRTVALDRALRQIDQGLARERPRVATRATRASKERRLQAKAHRARTKRDRRASSDD